MSERPVEPGTAGDRGPGSAPQPGMLPRLIEALSDPVVVLDRRGRVVAANHRFSEVFGAAGITLPGRSCPRSGECTGGDLPAGEACVSCEVAAANSPMRMLQVVRDSTGRQRRWEATLSPVLDDAGRLEYVVQVWRDITDRTQLEVQLAHSERLASLGLLAAGVAHELNNPLASIMACVEAMQRMTPRYELPDEYRTDVTEILTDLDEAMRRCADTTSKLLLLGQPHAAHPVEVDLNRAARDTLSLLKFASRKQGIETELDLADELPTVWGREDALRGMLMNLSLNAVQAMDKGGRLTLRTRQVGDHVVLEVQDDGPGIAPEHMERLWDPFFTTKPVGQGTGLGLSITRRIVSDHGGDIRVASTPGRGACFVVTLPLRSAGGPPSA